MCRDRVTRWGHLEAWGLEARNLVSAIDRRDSIWKLVQEGKPQEISNTLWAMAAMKVECPGLVDGIKVDAIRIMKNGDRLAISNTVYALVDLGYFEKGVFDALAGQVERVAREGDE